MKKALKELWLKKLSSGEFIKGTHSLRDMENKYCCLGILCEISGKGEWRIVPASKYTYYIGKDYSGGVVPEALRTKIKLSPTDMGNLIELNDDNDTWEEVIDYIRNNINED